MVRLCAPGASSDSGPSGGDGLVDDATVTQEHDPVGPRRQLRVVGDDDPATPRLARREQEPHHRLAVDRVERARRLVGQQQMALAHDGAGDRDPLALAAGELVGEALGARSPRPSSSSAAMPATVRLLGARRRRARAAAQTFSTARQPGQQVEVLEHVADRAAPQPRLVVARQSRHGRAVDEHLAARRLLEAAGDGQQRALARAARPHHRDQLARVDGQVDVRAARAPRSVPRRRSSRRRRSSSTLIAVLPPCVAASAGRRGRGVGRRLAGGALEAAVGGVEPADHRVQAGTARRRPPARSSDRTRPASSLSRVHCCISSTR